MIGYSLVMDGSRIRAVVVGGGAVAARKIAALLEAGASVHVIAPEIESEIRAQVDRGELRWTQSEYQSKQLGDATLVFAATSSDQVNLCVARDARERSIPVNVASNAEAGDFFTPATHRDGSLLVSVFASGVPSAAARIRDFIVRQIDPRVGRAIARLAEIRRSHLESGKREQWRNSSRELVGDDFVTSIENGDFERRVERWR